MLHTQQKILFEIIRFAPQLCVVLYMRVDMRHNVNFDLIQRSVFLVPNDVPLLFQYVFNLLKTLMIHADEVLVLPRVTRTPGPN